MKLIRFKRKTKPQVKVGDRVPPNVSLHTASFPPKLVNVSEYIAGRTVIIIGLPGAFTSVCSDVHVPTYLELEDALREAGVDEVICFSVNDGAVVEAWAKHKNIKGTLLTMFGDPHSELTKALGVEMNHPIVHNWGLTNRCKRFAMLVVDGEVKLVKFAFSQDDPAGAERTQDTCATSILDAIRTMNDKKK